MDKQDAYKKNVGPQLDVWNNEGGRIVDKEPLLGHFIHKFFKRIRETISVILRHLIDRKNH